VLLLFGVWVSGVNLDELVKTPDLFDAKEDVCLRLSWERVKGAADPVRLCSEWIKLADPSGQPHQLTLFVGVVLLFGMWARRYLVSRYRLQIGPADSRSSSGLH
jgi:hypothetical protein